MASKGSFLSNMILNGSDRKMLDIYSIFLFPLRANKMLVLFLKYGFSNSWKKKICGSDECPRKIIQRREKMWAGSRDVIWKALGVHSLRACRSTRLRQRFSLIFLKSKSSSWLKELDLVPGYVFVATAVPMIQ